MRAKPPCMLALVAALAIGWSGPPAPSESEAPVDPLALDWSTSPGCPEREVVVDQIRAMVPGVGQPAGVGEEPQARLRVEGELNEASEGFEVRLRFAGSRGLDEREFSGRDCVALTRAAALVIAVALDPVETAEHVVLVAPEPAGADVEPMPEPEPEPEPAPTETQPDQPAEDEGSEQVETMRLHSTPGEDDGRGERATARLRGSIGVLAGGGWGPVGLGTGSLGLELTLLGEHWRATVFGLWLPPRRAIYDQGQVRHDGFVVGLRGCGVPRWRALEFPVCGALEAGAVRGAGVGETPQPREATVATIALAPSAGVRWIIRERIGLGVNLGAPISLVRGGFRIDATVVESLAPVGVRALAVVEVRFP